MQVGYLVFTSVMAISVAAALSSVRRPRSLGVAAAMAATGVNEIPLVVLVLVTHSTYLAVSADGLLDHAGGWVAFGLAVGTGTGLLVLAQRGYRARRAVSEAVSLGLGVRPAARGTRSVWRTLLTPLPLRPLNVRRVSNLSYGPAGRRNRLDVYRSRAAASAGETGAPLLVYLHGGGYFSGGKRREARAMLHHFATRGWVVVSATYRLRPRAGFHDHLVDAKRVLAWVHEHAESLGADGSRVVMSGSSAGGHLTALAALTPNDPTFQPGFEDADTSVTAAICLYGYFGVYYGRDPHERPSSSPLHHDGHQAPPFFLAHGDRDSYVPVDGARAMAAKLRAESSAAVVYAELPGGHHGFDVFRSLRSDAVLAGIDTFTQRVLATRSSAGTGGGVR